VGNSEIGMGTKARIDNLLALEKLSEAFYIVKKLSASQDRTDYLRQIFDGMQAKKMINDLASVAAELGIEIPQDFLEKTLKESMHEGNLLGRILEDDELAELFDYHYACSQLGAVISSLTSAIEIAKRIVDCNMRDACLLKVVRWSEEWSCSRSIIDHDTREKLNELKYLAVSTLVNPAERERQLWLRFESAMRQDNCGYSEALYIASDFTDKQKQISAYTRILKAAQNDRLAGNHVTSYAVRQAEEMLNRIGEQMKKIAVSAK
jgi:hypothetical protein